jgi:hypothetical protein
MRGVCASIRNLPPVNVVFGLNKKYFLIESTEIFVYIYENFRSCSIREKNGQPNPIRIRNSRHPLALR